MHINFNLVRLAPGHSIVVHGFASGRLCSHGIACRSWFHWLCILVMVIDVQNEMVLFFVELVYAIIYITKTWANRGTVTV